MDAPTRTAGSSALPALAVGLVLADSSVVTLGLPEILRTFDSSVAAVAWVLVAFNLALAIAAMPGALVARRHPRHAFAASLALFALACVACAAAPSLGFLILARVAQGVLGAVAVAAALELLVARAGRERAIGRWAAAGVLGAALGPAVGGLLTEALSWEAMFALQAPVALLALAGARGPATTWRPRSMTAWPPLAPLVALGIVSAALSAALFLLVLLLIEGWRHSPAEAAATVTVMPLAALAAGRAARGRHGLALAGAGTLLVAGGLGALGLLPDAGPAWTLVPQLAIGAGLGIALPALTRTALGGSAGEDAEASGGALARPAAWTITARHLGIVLGLLALTPVFTADLDRGRPPAERAGLARLLDAPLPLAPKIELARRVDDQIDAAAGELPDLGPAFAGVAVPARDRPALARLRSDLDAELDRAATDAFDRSFRVAALLALLALVPLALGGRWWPRATSRAAAVRAGAGAAADGSRLAPGRPLPVALTGSAALAAALVAAYAVLGGTSYGSTPVADPCAPRQRAGLERLGGTQRAVLAALDGAACRLRVSREEMLLGLLTSERPAGATDGELADALRSGIERARSEGALSATEASVLLLALSTGGTDAILGLLLGAE